MVKIAKYFNTTTSRLRGETVWNADFRPLALCAECGKELSVSPEGFPVMGEDGEEVDSGDGILRVWPCETCCKEDK